jgi:hypothetical protein
VVVHLSGLAVSSVRRDDGRTIHDEYFWTLLFDDVRVFWTLVTECTIKRPNSIRNLQNVIF